MTTNNDWQALAADPLGIWRQALCRAAASQVRPPHLGIQLSPARWSGGEGQALSCPLPPGALVYSSSRHTAHVASSVVQREEFLSPALRSHGHIAGVH